MVSGLKHIHPLYPQNLQQSFLHPNRIEDVLLDIPESVSFDEKKLDGVLEPKVAVVIARYKSSRFCQTSCQDSWKRNDSLGS